MDFNFLDFPALPYAEQNAPREVSAETSAKSTVSSGAFAPKMNDVFTFPYIKDGKVIAIEQDVTGTTNVSTINGNKYIKSEDIIKILDIKDDKNIFRYNINNMEKILLSNKYIVLSIIR